MKFRKVDPEKWRSFDGRYQIRELAKVRNGLRYEVKYSVLFTVGLHWLGDYWTYQEAVTACRNHAADLLRETNEIPKA